MMLYAITRIKVFCNRKKYPFYRNWYMSMIKNEKKQENDNYIKQNKKIKQMRMESIMSSYSRSHTNTRRPINLRQDTRAERHF